MDLPGKPSINKPSNIINRSWLYDNVINIDYLHDVLSNVIPHPNTLLLATSFKQFTSFEHSVMEFFHGFPQFWQAFSCLG